MLTFAVATDAVLVPWRPLLLRSPAVTLLALRHQQLLKVILETFRSPPLVPSRSDVKVVDVKSSAVATLALRQQWLLKVILETSRSPPLVPSQSDVKVVGVNSDRFCSCPLEVALRSSYPLEVVLRPIYCTTHTTITAR